MRITLEQFIQDSKELAKKIPKNKYRDIYGIPAGGLLPAYIISQETGIPMAKGVLESGKTLIVDDLIDSGKTLGKFLYYDTAVLYTKPHSPRTTYFLEQVDEWIDLPHDKGTDSEDLIVRMFEKIGENPNREGLQDTPARVVKMWKEIFRGYDESQKPKITVFDNDTDGIKYDQMILDSGSYYSQCEHHMVPFFGKYNFAYIPDKKILGLSKVARIVQYYSAKLQVQERLTKEIVDEIEKAVQPLGIALIMKGRHLCKEMRGIRDQGEMVTSEMRGVFKEKSDTRVEFLRLIKS